MNIQTKNVIEIMQTNKNLVDYHTNYNSVTMILKYNLNKKHFIGFHIYIDEKKHEILISYRNSEKQLFETVGSMKVLKNETPENIVDLILESITSWIKNNNKLMLGK